MGDGGRIDIGPPPHPSDREREIGYQLVDSDLRDRRVSAVRFTGSVVSADRLNPADETVTRVPSMPSLLAAVDELGVPA